MNIAEILKNTYKGIKLYSPICGECFLSGIEDYYDGTMNIIVKTIEDKEEIRFYFNHEGKYNHSKECLLFPSKDNRDWSTFKPQKEHICEVCSDNRFEIIEKAKKDLLDSTNIETSTDEMKVLDNFLFRCWQMGWLKKYETKQIVH